MPEPPARLWLNQAGSDWKTAECVLDLEDEETFCQAIAKYQQVVEKAVKSIAVACGEVGIGRIRPGFSHDVNPIVDALIRLPRGKTPAEIDSRIKTLLSQDRRFAIKVLCDLAPKRPGPGELARRNTEYPFQRSDGSWIAPHEEGAFQPSDVERFRALASQIFQGSDRIISALARLPRPRS